MDRLGGLVVIAPARRAGDPGSNPGPGENFSLKLLKYIYIYIYIYTYIHTYIHTYEYIYTIHQYIYTVINRIMALRARMPSEVYSVQPSSNMVYK